MTRTDPTRTGIEATLDEAWQALGEGRVEELMVLLGAIEDDTAAHPDLAGEFTLLSVEARLGLFDVAGAEAALRSTRAPEGDPTVLQAHGEFALATWKLEAAQVAFEKLAASADTRALAASAAERLALLADLEGDEERARELLPGRPRLTPRAFDAIVERAARSLPADLRAIFDRVPVLIDPVPGFDFAFAAGTEPLEVPPDVLGLFVGSPDTEPGASGELPAHIRLFQRNLERIAENEAHLIEEITKTLFHELGHALGHDEDGVDALGLH
jgi:predicted Zn-dependent protease with MMP-like domain